MIPYEPKNWLKLSFSYQGTVIPRMMGRVLFLTGLAAVIFLAKGSSPGVENILKQFKPLGHTLIGVAMGLLIVFRNNCSYDRYWEGRKLWGGIVNTSRNLLRGAAVHSGAEVKDLANLTTAYALALKQHLRGNKDLSEIRDLTPAPVLEQASATTNPPSIIALHMSRWIAEQQFDNVTAQGLEAQVRQLLDNQGGCERILRTPIPFAYAVHIKQLLFLYLVSLPFILVSEMGWMAVPAVAAIAFGLLGIEEAGVEIEDPFGDDPNDLPIETMCATIARDVQALAQA